MQQISSLVTFLALLTGFAAAARPPTTFDLVNDNLPPVNRSDTAVFDAKRSFIPPRDSIDEDAAYIRLVFHVYRRIRFNSRTKQGQYFSSLGNEGILWDRNLRLASTFPPQHRRLIHPYAVVHALNAVHPPPQAERIADGMHVLGFLREWSLTSARRDARRWWPRRKWVTYLVWIPTPSAARVSSVTLNLRTVRKVWWRRRPVMRKTKFSMQFQLPETEGEAPAIVTQQGSDGLSQVSEMEHDEALEARFKKAVYLIQHGPKRQTSNEVKLKYYSLYKQATVGDNRQRKPSMFDFVAMKKWDAWTKLKGLPKQEAMRRYIRLIEEAEADWEQHPALQNYHE